MVPRRGLVLSLIALASFACAGIVHAFISAFTGRDTGFEAHAHDGTLPVHLVVALLGAACAIGYLRQTFNADRPEQVVALARCVAGTSFLWMFASVLIGGLAVFSLMETVEQLNTLHHVGDIQTYFGHPTTIALLLFASASAIATFAIRALARFIASVHLELVRWITQIFVSVRGSGLASRRIRREEFVPRRIADLLAGCASNRAPPLLVIA